jgi:transcriptional regulator with XRE-family HTH domain
MTTLAELRRAAGLTQMALASKIGTTPARVSGWENRGVMPSGKYLARLSTALGITADELLRAIDADAKEHK